MAQGTCRTPYQIQKTRQTHFVGKIRTKIGQGQESATKRRKLGLTQAFGSQPTESSFADVLQRLKEEAGDGVGTLCIQLNELFNDIILLKEAEGGADQWARPFLSPLNEKQDTISTVHRFLTLPYF